jgi:hypothetical protein
MKTILAEAEELQASGRIHHPAMSSSIPMHRQRSGESMGVSFPLSKTSDAPHSGSPNSSRASMTPAWRIHTAVPHLSSSPTGRASKNPPLPAQPLARSLSASVQAASKTPPTHLSGAPMTHKSWSTQSSPSSSTHPGRPGLGPVISPPKVKAGLTATHYASYVYFLSTIMGKDRCNIHATAGMHGICLRWSQSHSRRPVRPSPSPKYSSCKASRKW